MPPGAARPRSRASRSATARRSAASSARPARRSAALRRPAASDSAAARASAALARSRETAARAARAWASAAASAAAASRSPSAWARARPSASAAARARAAPTARRAASTSSSSAVARSAARAWRSSARARPRTSPAMSRARSSRSATRPSFSSARRRRRLATATPAAASTIARRSAGVLVQSASTCPWRMTASASGPTPRAGERLLHVEQPADGAVEPVVRVAGAGQPACRLDLRRRRSVDLVAGEDQLDLGHRGGRPARAARVEDVRHPPGPEAARALLAERPRHGLGEVALSGAVGPHDDVHARSQLQRGLVGERLESAHREAAQHAAPDRLSRARASAAATCSEACFEVPLPRPSSRPSTSARLVKVRRSGGPSCPVSS